MKNVAIIFSDFLKSEDLLIVKEMHKFLTNKYQTSLSCIGSKNCENFSKFSELTNEDMVISVGGDGTLLRAISYFQNRKTPPILGFNAGSFGFLPQHNLYDWRETLADLSEIKHTELRSYSRIKVFLLGG